jgi:hypothetical protein
LGRNHCIDAVVAPVLPLGTRPLAKRDLEVESSETNIAGLGRFTNGAVGFHSFGGFGYDIGLVKCGRDVTFLSSGYEGTPLSIVSCPHGKYTSFSLNGYGVSGNAMGKSQRAP